MEQRFLPDKEEADEELVIPAVVVVIDEAEDVE